MKTLARLAARSILLSACLFAAACGLIPEVPGLPGPAVPTPGPTLTPLPTSTGKAFPTVDDRSCLLAELTPLRVDAPQGDLLAWQPGGGTNALAFVGPAASSNWFAGALHLAEGPAFTGPTSLAPESLVFGDLAWSPSGNLLAYAALRISDGVYTILTVSAQGGPAQDWLPGDTARTEDGSSQKAILAWQGENRLRILSACGPDCDQILQIDLDTGQISQVGELIRRAKDRLAPHTNLTTFDETTYPYMLSPNWSPDLSKIVYFDEDDRAMLLLVDQKQQYILDTGVTNPSEAKWAYDNRTLAVRTDDVIYVFDTLCK